MTIIPDDFRSKGDDRSTAERIDDAGRRAEDATRRIAAGIQGALEGFVEALDHYDVAEEGRQAVHEAGEIARAGGAEARVAGQSPEFQQIKRGATVAGHKTADAARATRDRVAGAAHDARESAAGTAHDVREAVGERVDQAREAAHEAAESVKYAAARAKEEVKVRAEAVAESGRRARVAPGRVKHELGEAFAAWKRGLVTSLAMFAALTIFATIALIVLTIALVVGLNALLGDPAGTFVVAAIYLVVAGIAFAVAKGARTRAAAQTKERVENAREEIRYVGAPVKDAFGRGRSGI